jgi:hemoglobin-like flavoprotein
MFASTSPCARRYQRLLESNLDLLRERAPHVITRAYGNLFTDRRDLARLFNGRVPAVHDRKVLDAIAAIVGHADDPAWLRKVLRPLGAKHAPYGVTESMYPVVAQVFVSTFAAASGSARTSAIQDAWVRLFWGDESVRLSVYCGRRWLWPVCQRPRLRPELR